MTVVGLAFLALVQLAGPTGVAGQTAADLVEEPSGARRPGLEKCDPRSRRLCSRIRSPLPSRPSAGQVPEQRPKPIEPRVRPFVQGGLYGVGEGAGFVFGGGATVSPFAGVRILGDGNVINDPGYSSAMYTSGTLAYQIGSDDGENALVGIGMGLHGSETGPQFVLGVGVKAGFAQIRVVRLGYIRLFLLLGGVKFQGGGERREPVPPRGRRS